VCAATGGSFPPHWIRHSDGTLLEDANGWLRRRDDIDEGHFFCGEDYSRETHPGLFEFLTHSDCDGEISPEMCIKVADDLEELLPKVEALGWQLHGGHIAARGGFGVVLQKFISGCRRAADEKEPLRFR
jgi:hypothetical protein